MIRFNYKSSKDFNKNDGVKLDDYTIQGLVNDVVDGLKRSDYSYSITGDTAVFGFRYKNDDNYTKEYDDIDIYVCKNYEQAMAWYDYSKEKWQKMDWERSYIEDEEEDLETLNKDELIDIIIKQRHPDYNPRKEV